MVRLRGDPDHPITRGFLCYRTDHYLDRQYSEERLKTPLIRRGGELVPATWDEALDLVAEKLAEARKDFGAESIFHYQSGGSLGILKLLNGHFFDFLGPVTRKRGDICSGAGDAAQLTDMGHEDAHDAEDLANSKTILLWGKNVAETGTHLIPMLRAARARGATVIQIDPVHNARTLALCDRYYAVRPGGDGFLALGVARALLDLGMASKDAPHYCDGYDEFVALARRRTLEEWADLADLSPADVRAIAFAYGGEKPAALYVGWGLARRVHGSATVRLLDALGALSGNLGTPGGGVSYYFQRRGGFDVAFMSRPERDQARTLLEPLLGEELLSASPKIRVAVVDNGNPVSQLPDSNAVARGLSSVDFLVVLDAFLTDTAELADVVLPTTTMLEEHEVVGSYGHSYVQLAQPVVAPPEGVLSDLAIYQALANRLGFGGAMAGSAESFIDRALAPMAAAGVTREALKQGGLRKPEAPYVLFEDKKFKTPSGRFQLITDFPDAPPPLEEGYPLHLLSIASAKSQASQIARADQTEPPTILVHPEAAPGHEEGALVRLVSPIAEVTVRLSFDVKQRPDVVIHHKGRWSKFGGPNVLVRARATDAGGGAAYYDQGVRIEPLSPPPS